MCSDFLIGKTVCIAHAITDSYLHMNTGIDCEDETPTYSLSNCQEILESELDDTHSIISLRSSHEKSFANP